MKVSAEKQVSFLLFIQRLLEEGQFSSTYKFALLQAIANLCVERGRDGEFLEFDARDLAAEFVQGYWPQTIEFRGMVLLHGHGKQVAIVKAVEDASRNHNGSILRFRKDRTQWNALLTRVASIIVKMPLWKLQNIGGREEQFLYTRGETRRSIRIAPEIAFCFRQFYPLVIELAQSAWTNFIRSVGANRRVIGADGELQEFLFGVDRRSLAKFEPILRDAQNGLCFYCARPVDAGKAHVDHFIPWSRFRSDLGHNFVLADGRCNGGKLDRLAGVPFLGRWAERNLIDGERLALEFQAHGIAHDLEASRRIAFFAYERAEEMAASLWLPPRELAPIDAGWRALLT